LPDEVSGCETFEVTPVPLIMNFPRLGRYTLPAGITKIDVKTGQVTIPGVSAPVEMYSAARMDTCKSFLIFTDAQIELRAYLAGALVYTSSVFPLWTRSKLIEFDYIEISTDYSVSFYIAMSNVADAMASIDPITNIAARHIAPTDRDTQFTDALVTNAVENENLSVAISKPYITNIAIMSVQNLNYRLVFYSKDRFGALEYIGNIDFDLPTEGVPLNSLYCMNVHDITFDYIDEDNSDEIHMQLINLDAVAKLAGAAGAVQFTVIYGENL